MREGGLTEEPPSPFEGKQGMFGETKAGDEDDDGNDGHIYGNGDGDDCADCYSKSVCE